MRAASESVASSMPVQLSGQPAFRTHRQPYRRRALPTAQLALETGWIEKMNSYGRAKAWQLRCSTTLFWMIASCHDQGLSYGSEETGLHSWPLSPFPLFQSSHSICRFRGLLQYSLMSLNQNIDIAYIARGLQAVNLQ